MGRGVPRLEDLFDVGVLEQIQDWFAGTAHLTTRVRGMDGRPVTRASNLPRFCQLVGGCRRGRELCDRSSRGPLQQLAATRQPVEYVCHAGLTQFAAPIEVDGQLLGAVVVGGIPKTRLTREEVTALAHRIAADPDELAAAAQELPLWEERVSRETSEVLRGITNALASILYRGYQLKQQAERLGTVYDAIAALTAPLSLRQRLELILQEMVAALGAAGASLRLRDPATGYLELRATHGLSDEALSRGPVLPEAEGYEAAALAGETVTRLDVTQDEGFPQREAAAREGLRSLLCVGLIHRDQAIGTVSIWTAEPRAFTPDEIELTRLLARQAAVAVEAATLFDDLRRTNRHLRRAYQDLVETQEMLVAADRLVTVGRLTSGITHEVRNALASMSATAAVLRDRGETLTPGKREQFAQVLVDQAMRLGDTLEAAQQYAKPVDPRERTEVALEELVSDAVDFIRLDGALRGVQFAIQAADQAPHARVNEKRLRQVVSNLLRNAAQAALEGGGHVRVECGWDEEPAGRAATIRISDDGPGIPPDLLERIWEPFFTTKGSEGMGLGLDICRRIVAAHGGTITVDSAPGRGAAFTVRLPEGGEAEEEGEE